MRSHPRIVIGSVIGVGILMILILGFHLGGKGVLRIGLYSQLLGAFIGGTLTIVSMNLPSTRGASTERERLAWTLIGAGCIMWGIGECFWRYYLSIGQNPFPSLADIGYSSFPPLVFLGLLLQPAAVAGRQRLLILLDSLISMGAILAIAWFVLLGALAQAPGEANLAKFLGLYYPTTDMALLSCVIFLLLRGQERNPARRFSLLLLGAGLFVFATSDFIFNIQQSAGTYVDGTWIDLGWPLGMMIMGIAAYLRCYLPQISGKASEVETSKSSAQSAFGLVQAVPYILLALLFLVLGLNVFSTDGNQLSIRAVLLIATVMVVGLVVVRQIITILDNQRLLREQTAAFEQLETMNHRITERSASLESGVAHLKDVQTRLANGDVRARASLISGELWPLTHGLNLMADRMMRSEQGDIYRQKLEKALLDLRVAFDRYNAGVPFVFPASCYDFSEIQQLVRAMGFRPVSTASWPPVADTPISPSQRPPSAPLKASSKPPYRGPEFSPEKRTW